MSGPGPRQPYAEASALAGHGLRNARSDEELDELARLAALACDAPFAAICFPDEQHCHFLGTCGFSTKPLPDDWAICARALQDHEPLVVADLSAELAFRDTELVATEPFLRACAGVRVPDRKGLAPGCLLVMDSRPRRIEDERVTALASLARQVAQTLELRRLRAPASGDPGPKAGDDLPGFDLGNAPLAAVEWDRDFRPVRWSRQAELLFGWKASEVLGRDFREWDFVHPDDQQRVNRELGVLVNDGKQRNRITTRNLTRDGREVHCEWYNSIQYDHRGEVLSILSQARDITEHLGMEKEREQLLTRERQARREAEIAREEFRSLFEAAPGAYIVLTPGDYEVAAANRAYLALTMRHREEVIGFPYFELLAGFADPEESGNVERALREALTRVETSLEPHVMGVMRCPLRTPDGEEDAFVDRYWSPIHTPVTSRDGKLLYIIQRIEDVTDYIRERHDEAPSRMPEGIERQAVQRMEAEIVLRSRELQQVNERLQRSRRIGQLGGCEMDLVDDRVRWDSETCRIFGIKPSEFSGTFDSFLDKVHHEDRTMFLDRQESLYKGHDPESMEFRIVRPDGEVRHLFEVIEVERDREGAPLRLNGVVQDITDRKKAEMRLRENERLLQIAGRLSRVGAWFFDSESGKAFLSGELCSLLDLPDGTTATMKDAVRLHKPEYRKRIAAAFRLCVDAGTPFDEESEIRTLGGRRIHVRLIGEAERDVNGAVGRVHGVLQDITEHREAEERLREHERLIRIASQIARLGAWSYDPETGLAVWSDELCDIIEVPHGTRATVEQAIGFHAPEYRERIGRAFTNCIEHGIPFDEEVEAITSSGRRIHVRNTGEAKRGQGGKVIRLQGAFQDITERRKAEIRLSENERLLRIGNRIARMGAWSWDAATGASVWSDELCAILEVPPGTRPDSEQEGIAFHVAGDRERIANAFYACAREGTPFDEEVEVVTATGRHIDVRNTGEAERDRDGRITGVYGAFQDITERKEHEREVRDLATRLSNTLESINDAFFMVDRDWRFLYVNREAEKVFGESRDAFLGRLLWDMFPGAPGTEIEQVYREAMETGSARHFNSYYAPMECWFDIRAYPSEEGLAVYFQDITERRRDEMQLAKQAELLDKASDAILVRGLDHEIRFWNRGAERLYGWDRNEVLGRSVRELLYDDPSEFDRASAQVFEKGQWRGRIVQKHISGRALTMESNWTLMLDEKGKPESILAINTDITGRLSLEEQLRQSHRLEAVGQLTGGVAHDFNNLLTIILGNADFLTEDLGDPEKLDMVAMIRSAAQRGADLTRRLLTIARRQTLEPAPMQIDDLLVELKPLLERTLAENISLQLVLAEDPPNSFLDPSELESALLNLCINSRDAMPRGGEITIETSLTTLGAEYAGEQDLEAGDYILVAVSDTGSGIDPGHMSRVLDPFFSTKEQGKGTGLGLSMVYGFVKQSGGHMEIASEPDTGTVVNLFFPVTDAQPVSEEKSVPVETDMGGVEKVLLVDDDELVRRQTERQLRRLGYTVIAAGDGREALAVLEDEPDVELLLTDVVMPGGMYGPELARHAMDMNPGLRVLLMSGYARDLASGLDEGIDLLQKPYQRSELARKVRQAISGSLDNG